MRGHPEIHIKYRPDVLGKSIQNLSYQPIRPQPGLKMSYTNGFHTKLTKLISLALPTAVSALALSANVSSSNHSSAQQLCQYFASQMPNATYFANSSLYKTDESKYWSQACALGPACEFAPSCAEDLGWAVKVLKHYGVAFAMRGGGHMPVEGFNNINSSGVLLSSSGFTHLYLEGDGKSIHTGPANHWQDVWKFLEPYGKTIVGGRLGVVGIPGFVTGGGISFLSWQHGWASNNLKSYTVSRTAWVYSRWTEPVGIKGATPIPKGQWYHELPYAPVDYLVASRRWGWLFPTRSVHWL
jgi:hypothetical protein